MPKRSGEGKIFVKTKLQNKTNYIITFCILLILSSYIFPRKEKEQTALSFVAPN